MPTITRAVNLNGPGANALTIAGNNTFRLMNILLTAPGTVNINDLTFTGGRKASGENAAAIEFNNNGTLNVNRCELFNNSGPSAGAADASSLFFTNASAAFNLTASTLRNNAVEHVVEVGNTPFNITNCTISNNSGTGAAVFIFGGTINSTVNSSTIANNTQGIWHANGAGTSTVTIKGTLLSQNGGLNLRRTGTIGANNAISSNGYNLIDDNSFSQLTAPNANDLYGSSFNPQLAALGDNGGPTQTRALMSGSAARDKGGPGVSVDQRGFTRPLDDPSIPPASGGNNSDIGAYEVQTALGSYPTTTMLLSSSGTISPAFAPATNCTITSMVASAPSFTGAFSVDPLTGIVSVTSAGPVGAFTVTVTATNSCGESTSKAFTLNVTNTATWNGSASSDWNTAANWTPGFVPASINNVVIPSSGVSQEPSLSAATATVNNLTVASGRTLTLNGQDLTVNGVLTLSGGTISAGASTLNLGAAATVSRSGGLVTGNLKKTFGGAGSLTYPVGTANGYSPVDVTATAGAGDLTVKAVQGPQPAVDASQSLQRYWSLSGSGITVNLAFHYLDPTDLPVGGSDAGYHLIRVSGGTPQVLLNDCAGGSPCVNPAANTATINGVTSFSDWTAGEPGSVTAVRLDAANARGYDDGALIEWQTGFEADNLGFNLYRETGGRRERINPELIAGSALVAGRAALLSGRRYAWWDAAGASVSKASYYIEDVDLNGKTTLYGPINPQALVGNAPPSTQADGLSRRDQSTPRVSQVLPDQSASKRRTLDLLATRPAQAELAATAALKLSIKRTGWHHVSQAELRAAGLDSLIDPRRLRLFADGIEQPLLVIGESDGRLDAGDAVEFYGVALDTPSTDSHIYWLAVGEYGGKRIPVVESHAKSGYSATFTYTVERRDRAVYFAALRNGDADNFFGAVVTARAVEQTLPVSHLATNSKAEAWLEVALQVVTDQPASGDHLVNIALNGATVGAISFDGQQHKVERFALDTALLKEGDNTVTLTAAAGSGDVSLVDYLRIAYPHTYTADENMLVCTTAADGREGQTISGFTSPLIRIFDITDPQSPVELAGLIQESGKGFEVSVAVGAGRTLLAMTDAHGNRPTAIALNQPSALRQPGNGADLLILTQRDLFPSVEPLVKLRQSQGLSVSLIDVEDVYDEFSYGNKEPQAIKDFLRYATTSWKRRPQFVLLAGDASYDPHNYLGHGDNDKVPTKLLDTALMEAASDDWFGDVDGDGISELAIGRLPARTAAEAALMVTKILGYEQAASSDEVLLVADANEGYDFEAASKTLGESIPSYLRVGQINRGREDAAKAKAELLAAIGRGQKIVNYIGHGSLDTWRGGLLTTDEARSLNGDRLPFFVMMTCLNGFFDGPASDSLGESLLKAPRGGAVAVWASSGMAMPAEQSRVNLELYRQLFRADAKPVRIGDVVRRAKAATANPDVRRTWILLGDPTLRLR